MEPGLEQPIFACEHTFSNLIPGSKYDVSVVPVASMIKGKSSTSQVYTSK